MFKSLRWLHVTLEIVGALALLVGLGRLALWIIFKPFENFAGGACTDTGELVTSQPGGQHTIKSFDRECGGGAFTGYFVYLSTGNPNKGFEYTPIIELKNLAAGTAKATWDDHEHISISYPASAEVVDAYAKTFGIQITLKPHQN